MEKGADKQELDIGLVSVVNRPRKVFRIPENWTVIDISRLPKDYEYHPPPTSTLRRLVFSRGGGSFKVEPQCPLAERVCPADPNESNRQARP